MGSSAQAASTSVGLRLRRLLGRIRRSVAFDRFDVFVRPVAPADAAFPVPPGYRFAWAAPDDVARCDEHHTQLSEQDRRDGIARLALGHRCVIAFHGDLAVFSMWMNPRNLHVPGQIKRRLGPDQAFIYKAFTSPEHRGRGLYEAGMRFVLAALHAEGKRELLGYAHVTKAVSRKGLAAVRFESVGSFLTVRAPIWRHTFVSRKLGLRLPAAPDPAKPPSATAPAAAER